MRRVEWSVIYPRRCNNYSHLHTCKEQHNNRQADMQSGRAETVVMCLCVRVVMYEQKELYINLQIVFVVVVHLGFFLVCLFLNHCDIFSYMLMFVCDPSGDRFLVHLPPCAHWPFRGAVLPRTHWTHTHGPVRQQPSPFQLQGECKDGSEPLVPHGLYMVGSSYFWSQQQF